MWKALLSTGATGFPLRSRSTGTVSVEYALLLALLVVVGIAAWASFGETLRTALTEVINSFNEAGI